MLTNLPVEHPDCGADGHNVQDKVHYEGAGKADGYHDESSKYLSSQLLPIALETPEQYCNETRSVQSVYTVDQSTNSQPTKG